MYASQLVDVQFTPSLPPETQTPGNNYAYDPKPAQTNPPIGPNLLAHLFEHPVDAGVLPVLYRKIPKKLHAKLQACPQKGYAVGWGIQFIEGLNLFMIVIAGCFGFAAALISALAWAILRQDIQGGFAIAGFILAFVGFLLGIARAEAIIA